MRSRHLEVPVGGDPPVSADLTVRPSLPGDEPAILRAHARAFAHGDVRYHPAHRVLHNLTIAGHAHFARGDNAGVKRRQGRPQAEYAKKERN